MQQLEIVRIVMVKAGGPGLIVCPLGVRQEFKRDGEMLGVATRFIRRTEEVDVEFDGIHLTNYESIRDGRLDPNVFTVASLDEASVLRSYGSKTYQEFLPLFSRVRFKFVATATPSPNRYKELIHYAGFLGIMDTGQALAQPLTSKVLTPTGWVQMGDIKPGDKVIGRNGKATAVLGVYPQGEKEIFRVAFSDGTSTRCTAEAEQLQGSYINQKLPPEAEIPVSERELRLIGRWIADGHVETRGGFVVSIGAAKLDAFREMAGQHAGGESERTATQIRLVGLSGLAKSLLMEAGSGAANKQIPPVLFSLPNQQAIALLDGYLSGDGHLVTGRNRWMATTVSKKLALGISMLAQRAFGAMASIHAGRAPGQTVIDGRTVQTKQEWIVSFDMPDAERKNSLPFILDDGAWKKVRSIEEAGEVETWCLRVEEDESFTADGCIVKNCPLQFDIVDRLIERYSNLGETVYDPFGGLMTVPYRAILKGRNGRASELNTAYFFDGVQYLRSAEREVSMPDLFATLKMEEAA